jgi:hypothetical protein
MAPTESNRPAAEDGDDRRPPSEAKIGLALAACVVAIVAVIGAWALASRRFDLGPAYDPVTYTVLAIAAVALTANFLLTFVPNEIRAGAYLIGVWVLTFVALLLVFRFSP